MIACCDDGTESAQVGGNSHGEPTRRPSIGAVDGISAAAFADGVRYRFLQGSLDGHDVMFGLLLLEHLDNTVEVMDSITPRSPSARASNILKRSGPLAPSSSGVTDEVQYSDGGRELRSTDKEEA